MTDEITMINVVGKYIDGLHVSLFGDPKRTAFDYLRAQKFRRGLSELGILPGVPGGPVMLRARGRGRYLFTIENGTFEMGLTDDRGLPAMMPRARIRFRARALGEFSEVRL